MGIELAADDDVVIVREVTAAGRSQARINGVAVSASQLRAIGGTSSTRSAKAKRTACSSRRFARDLLDRFAGEAALALRERLRERYDVRRAAARRARRACAPAATRAGGAGVRALRARRDRSGGARRRTKTSGCANAATSSATPNASPSALARARAALEDERGAVDALGDATHALSGIARFGAAFAALAAERGRVAGRRERAGRRDRARARRRRTRSDRTRNGDRAARRDRNAEEEVRPDDRRDPGRARPVRGRRSRAMPGATSGWRRSSANSPRSMPRSPPTPPRCTPHAQRAIPSARNASRRNCTRWRCRRRASRSRSNRSTRSPRTAPTASSFASRRIPGEPERPLARIASGGERSRVLLALVVVLADRRDARTFVFDEIDAGIGGATAVAVGARLAAAGGASRRCCASRTSRRSHRGPTRTTCCASTTTAAKRRSRSCRSAPKTIAWQKSPACFRAIRNASRSSTPRRSSRPREAAASSALRTDCDG